MRTGWFEVEGLHYYANADGGMRSGWFNWDGNRYYLGGTNDGAMKTGWINLFGESYFLDSNGIMQTGWHELSRDGFYGGDLFWVYFTSSGKATTYADISGCVHGYANFRGKKNINAPSNIKYIVDGTATQYSTFVNTAAAEWNNVGATLTETKKMDYNTYISVGRLENNAIAGTAFIRHSTILGTDIYIGNYV